MMWLIQWVIVLIPVFEITSFKGADEKCKNRWGIAAFVVPLLLSWLAEFIVVLIEGERLPYDFMYEYASVPVWIWIGSAWGMYFYFRYRVKRKGTCALETAESEV